MGLLSPEIHRTKDDEGYLSLIAHILGIEAFQLERKHIVAEILKSLAESMDKRGKWRHQPEALDAFSRYFNQGENMLTALHTTGAGKSSLQAEIATKIISEGGRMIIITSRLDLVEDLYTKCGQKMIETVGFADKNTLSRIKTGNKRNWNAQVLVLTYPAFTTAIENGDIDPKDIDLLSLDEVHNAISEQQVTNVNYFKELDVPTISWTATPFLLNGNIEDMGYTIVHTLSLLEAVQREVISRFRVSHIKVELDDQDQEVLSEKDGDYSQVSISQFVKNKHLLDFVGEFWHKMCKDELTIIFCPDIESSELLEEVINTIQPNSAQSISGQNSNRQLQRYEEQLKDVNHPLVVVINNKKWSEGKDIPELTNLINVDFTASPAKHMQRVGRVLRYLPGKTAYIYELRSTRFSKAVSALDFLDGFQEQQQTTSYQSSKVDGTMRPVNKAGFHAEVLTNIEQMLELGSMPASQENIDQENESDENQWFLIATFIDQMQITPRIFFQILNYLDPKKENHGQMFNSYIQIRKSLIRKLFESVDEMREVGNNWLSINDFTDLLECTPSRSYSIIGKLIESKSPYIKYGLSNQRKKLTYYADPELKNKLFELGYLEKTWESKYSLVERLRLNDTVLEILEELYLAQFTAENTMSPYKKFGVNISYNSAETTYYSSEFVNFVEKLIERSKTDLNLSMLQFAPEGWKVVSSVAHDIGVFYQTVINLIKAFPEKFKGISREYRSQVGIRTFYSPDAQVELKKLIDQLPPDDWKSIYAIGGEAGISVANNLDKYEQLAILHSTPDERKLCLSIHDKKHRLHFSPAATQRVIEKMHSLQEQSKAERVQLVEYDKPPLNWITLNSSCDELKTTKPSYYKICEDLGFWTDPNHMCWAPSGQKNNLAMFVSPYLHEQIAKVVGKRAPEGWLSVSKVAREKGNTRKEYVQDLEVELKQRYAHKPEWLGMFRSNKNPDALMLYVSVELWEDYFSK